MGKFYSNQPNQNIIMQRKLEKICGLSDEQILREFEKAQKNTCPLPIKPPPADEFERICRRVEAERRKILTAPQRVKWKRVAAVGLLAAALTGSGCFVALGRKSYFYREGRRNGSSVVFNNDSRILDVKSEEDAYSAIKEELDIQPLKLGYRPLNMHFQKLSIEKKYARMEYWYDEQPIFFIQSKFDTMVSNAYASDGEKIDSVWNKWLNTYIEIEAEQIDGGVNGYEAQFTYNGAYYCIFGVMDKGEFLALIEKIHT